MLSRSVCVFLKQSKLLTVSSTLRERLFISLVGLDVRYLCSAGYFAELLRSVKLLIKFTALFGLCANYFYLARNFVQLLCSSVLEYLLHYLAEV